MHEMRLSHACVLSISCPLTRPLFSKQMERSDDDKEEEEEEPSGQLRGFQERFDVTVADVTEAEILRY